MYFVVPGGTAVIYALFNPSLIQYSHKIQNAVFEAIAIGPVEKELF